MYWIDDSGAARWRPIGLDDSARPAGLAIIGRGWVVKIYFWKIHGLF
jgi:hypothetical protein